MKKISLCMVTVLLFAAFITAGCQNEPSGVGQTVLTKTETAQAAVSADEVNKNDRAFLTAFKQSLARAERIVVEYNLMLAEMEHQDEAEEALEHMKTAGREMLYLWNTIHNESHPARKDLQLIKQAYETTLMTYKKGIDLQIEGLTQSSGAKAIEGKELTKKAESELKNLKNNR
ncbi:hypothetical protein DFP93_10550 [Aneurinibacillus soli]|uniref:Uncharacterized protein n=1 Tax=Aneurinibacillus soli TaxID=1500254 RepID=A0A0U5AY79_9BACL|nr:hypothetical protein [Aneurinibacillus soli]PYE62098.1 hypothetical protein DFP93_10550 [Aneurinibacillus soli]BAU28714.1 hypothetical protein CB4_02889 [Aneurinibacillus soli]